MTGWLTKASNVFRRTAPEVEHPFAVTCECGVMHRGLRKNRSQKILCRECGASRFILPKDVYPAPKERRLEPPPPPVAIPVLNPVVDPQPEKRKAGKDKKKPSVPRDATPEFFIPARGKLVTPFRVVVLSISLSVLATGYFVWQKTRRDKAVTTLRDSAKAAWDDVAAGDWQKAHEHLHKAVAASAILGRDDVASRRLNCGLREVTSLEELSPKTLLEILTEADASIKEPEKWSIKFDGTYRGRWLVFDAPLRRVDESWLVEFPVKIGQKQLPVRVSGPSQFLEPLKKSDAASGVVAAAKLESCRLADDKKRWIVNLEPNSLFLWTLSETYSALGFQADDFRPAKETEALLTKQAALNGAAKEDSE